MIPSRLSAAERLHVINQSRQLARLVRPGNTRISIFLYLIAGLGLSADIHSLIFGSFAIFFSYATMGIINDIADVEIDRANHRDLPLATGAFSQAVARRAARLFFGLFCLCAVLTFHAGFVAVALFGLAIGAAYSLPPVALERRGLLGIIALAYYYVGSPLVLAYLVGAGSFTKAWPIILSLTILESAALLFKDFKDEAGDRALGKLTPLVRYGRRATLGLACGIFVIGACFSAVSSRSAISLIGLAISAAALAGLVGHNRSKRAIFFYNLGLVVIAAGF